MNYTGKKKNLYKSMRGKPTEKEILVIKDYRDEYYCEALEHASNMLGFAVEVRTAQNTRYNSKEDIWD